MIFNATQVLYTFTFEAAPRDFGAEALDQAAGATIACGSVDMRNKAPRRPATERRPQASSSGRWIADAR